ncbi:MAG: hypothetical protein O7H41_03755 [Planctomycetota bacterium]|nr:hypothetical protein [Planctomycetota bacterium]
MKKLRILQFPFVISTEAAEREACQLLLDDSDRVNANIPFDLFRIDSPRQRTR